MLLQPHLLLPTGFHMSAVPLSNNGAAIFKSVENLVVKNSKKIDFSEIAVSHLKWL